MFLIDVINVKALPNRKLDLTFEDGLQAVVELDRVVKNYMGVFAPLLDENYFRLVKLDPELGTIVWPNGADVCPDVLYSHASGTPIATVTHPLIASPSAGAGQAQAQQSIASPSLRAKCGNPSPNHP